MSYAVCAVEEDSCAWQGWILDGVFKDKTAINRLVKRLLRASLGLEKPAAVDRRADFEDLFGGWSEEEYRRFKHRLADLEHVAPDEW